MLSAENTKYHKSRVTNVACAEGGQTVRVTVVEVITKDRSDKGRTVTNRLLLFLE